MGAGKWTADSYAAYATATNYVHASRQEVFSNTSIAAALNPKNVMLRESCDSTDNPLSTPLIVGLDVTASMGDYAELVAKKALPKLMEDILQERPITDPHLMCMAFTDINTGSYMNSLQVSQFEADIRILEQLRQIYLAGGGGGNRSESYDLVWYFAGTRTSIDSMKKRGQKGYIFTIGDERAPYEDMPGDVLGSVLGGQHETISPKQSLKMAQENYQVFHLVIEQGSGCSSYHERKWVDETWTDMLGNNVLFLSDFSYISDVVMAVLKINSGAVTLQEAVETSRNPEVLRHAFKNALKQSA